MQTARDIYQANLDAVTRALWVMDVAAAREHIALPKRMVTDEGDFVVTNEADMRLLMQDFRNRLTSLGAEAYHRVCLTAQFANARQDIIHGTHRTFILRDGQMLVHGRDNHMVLVKNLKGWQVTEIDASVEPHFGELISDAAVHHLSGLPRHLN